MKAREELQDYNCVLIKKQNLVIQHENYPLLSTMRFMRFYKLDPHLITIDLFDLAA